MDTLLGLSIRPTTVGWVLADGPDADAAMLARDEFTVGRHRGGVGAVDTSEQVAAVVRHAEAMLQAQGRRLGGVGVTWSGDAATEAALVLESLAGAGVDNVVPVRLDRAAEVMALGVGGSERAAVCVIEPGLMTVVMPRGSEADGAGAIRQAFDAVTGELGEDGDDGLVGWLTTLLRQENWCPDVLVIAGSKACPDALAVRLETELGIPVFVQAGAQLALARGAALAGPGVGIAHTEPDGSALPDADIAEPGRRRSRPLPYAGALAMLAVGVPTFVVSLSIALSLQLAPGSDVPPGDRAAQAAHSAQVAQLARKAHVVAAPVAPAEAADVPAQASLEATGTTETAGIAAPSFEVVPEGDAAFQPTSGDLLSNFGNEVAMPVPPRQAPAAAPKPDHPRSMLMRALDRLRGLHP